MTKAGNKCFLLVLVTVAALLAALVQPAPPVKADPGWVIETIDSAANVRAGGSSSIVLDSSGNPHISYTYVNTSTWTGAVKYASYNGTDWNTETVASGLFYTTSLALDNSDHPHISFYYNNLTGDDDYKYASYNGTAWQIQTIESGVGAGISDMISSIAVDSSDSPHVSFRHGTQGIKYASYNGTAWNTEIVDSNCSESNSLAIDNDVPHISYNKDTSGTYLGYATYNGTSWDTTQVTTGGNYYTGRYNSIAIDSSDYPHISHTYLTSGTFIGDLNYAYKDASGWHNQTVDSDGDVGYWTSLALDGSDHPHISYILDVPPLDQAPYSLKYASYNGTAWNIETVDTESGFGATSLALDSCDYPHISYHDVTGTWTGDLKYARFVPAPGLSVSKGGSAVSKVGDNVTYWVAITNTGDVPLQKVSVTDTLVPGIDGLFSATLSVGASENRTYTCTVQAGDEPGPIINTITAVYGDAYGGTCFSNLSVSDNHSVTLVHPSISVSKGGPPISKVGDTITYWAAVTNTGDCTLGKDSVSDSLVAGIDSLFSATLAPSVTDNQTYTYAVQAGDPDPLDNTITALYYLPGFSDVISDNATCTVDLRHPDILVTKGVAAGTYRLGDDITYFVRIDNTSTDITLVKDSITDSLAGDITSLFGNSIAAGGSDNHTYTYTVKVTDPDPLLNDVTVHYHPEGLTNDIFDSTYATVFLAPTITSVNPDQGSQGQTLNIVITGSQLNRVDAVDLGAGITVNGFTVDSTQITASISIDANAALGPRDVTVTNPVDSDTLTGGFAVQQSQASVATATGTGTATFMPNAGSITSLTASATTPCGSLSGLSFPHGFFSFTITGITPGSTVTITINLPSNMPAGTQYWKCINGQWVNATSILGDNDGDNILTLTITDGSQFDADGQANGTIVDPGGPAVPVAVPPTAGTRASPSPQRPLSQPSLSLQYLNVIPQQASAGQAVTIAANVVNTGGEVGNYNVILKINGQVEQSKMVSVGPRTAQQVKFTVTRSQPGTYTVDIGGGQRDSFTVGGQSGSTTRSSPSGGLIAIIIVGVLVLVTLVTLVMSFRRTA